MLTVLCWDYKWSRCSDIWFCWLNSVWSEDRTGWIFLWMSSKDYSRLFLMKKDSTWGASVECEMYSTLKLIRETHWRLMTFTVHYNLLGRLRPQLSPHPNSDISGNRATFRFRLISHALCYCTECVVLTIHSQCCMMALLLLLIATPHPYFDQSF